MRYSRTHYYRDPTSAFFDPERGFDPIYSRFRTSQATDFIHSIDATASPQDNNTSTANSNASFCMGIASIARGNVNYIEAAIGSLLVDLTQHEREDIYLILFIPHTDPTVHPSYSSNWVSAMVDKVLVYEVNSEKLNHLKELETAGGLFREKALFDYTWLLKACQTVGSPYILMVEDDVIAMDGWYHRTKRALAAAEQQTRQLGASKYLYLRLFYTEKFLGWNKEEWFTYFLCSFVAVTSIWTSLVITRRYVSRTRRFLPDGIIPLLCFICVPLCIVLFFSAGRVSMLPMPNGVYQMPRFGCCAQALAFPRARVADIISWYESKGVGFADSLLEEYANANDEIRWALTPSVFQHVGVISSKDDGPIDIYDAKSTWNFQFELNDPIALQLEHEVAAQPLYTPS
ncbi:hypothetical protein FQN57_001893 [Myotisia sp. PD_48]|nr:hypothetical protein FQN57_001893 [Myotisia sp. PD_48]